MAYTRRARKGKACPRRSSRRWRWHGEDRGRARPAGRIRPGRPGRSGRATGLPPGPAWRGPRADPGRLSGLVHALVALGPRNDAAGQSRAADWIRGQIVGGAPFHGERRLEEQRYVANGESFRNLVVHLGPQTQDRIVIGAHYDVRGPYPGADDNASEIGRAHV